MYHDLLFALNGITGDVFQEHGQSGSYSIVQVATGLQFLDVCEEALLNRDILPLASHVLFLQRFVDQDPEPSSTTKPQQQSFYLFILRNAVEEILDTYRERLNDLEQTLLARPEFGSLPKIHNTLLPWFIPLERIARTIFQVQRDGSFNSKIIDDFNTVAESSGNTHTQRWFKFLAQKCTKVLENQTRELLFGHNLVDPYNEYFITDTTNFKINFDRIPQTVLTRETAQKIAFITRTLHILRKESPATNSNFTDATKAFDFYSEEDKRNFTFDNAACTLESMKVHANKQLVDFIGKDRICGFFTNVKNLFFLADSVSWIQFLAKLQLPHQATQLFDNISDHRYEEMEVKFKVASSDTASAKTAQLDQTLVVVEDESEFTTMACDIYETTKERSDTGKNILSRLNLQITAAYPFNLIFDDWSLERYNMFWRFLLRLSDISQRLQDLRRYSIKIKELTFVLYNLQTYVCSDVLECLISEYFTEARLYSGDFETVVTSHRQFLLRAMQQSFLLSRMLFGQITELLNCIDRFARKSQQTDDLDEYNNFQKYLAILFTLLTKTTRMHSRRHESRFLKMLMLRLDYNHYFSKKYLNK